MDLTRVHPILLQTFLTVAEAGQISEAARRLHLSQPAVTGQIRRLESNLQTALFVRSAHGVTLTPEGALLRERVQEIFANLEELLQELGQSREVTGIVALAASSTLARYFVPRIFLRFRRYHPGAGLNLVMGNTEGVLDYVRQQHVTLGLVEGHQHAPGVRLEPFLPDEIIPVCAVRIPDSKLRRRIEAASSARDLQDLPLIWREPGAGSRAVVEKVLEENGVNPRKLDYHFQLGSSEAIKSLVIAGLGIGFFSSWEIQQEIALGFARRVHLPELRIQRMFSWALSTGQLHGPAAEFYQFANSIRDELLALRGSTFVPVTNQ
jgi:DNA-binding transcriptional LysR family regulator